MLSYSLSIHLFDQRLHFLYLLYIFIILLTYLYIFKTLCDTHQHACDIEILNAIIRQERL